MARMVRKEALKGGDGFGKPAVVGRGQCLVIVLFVEVFGADCGAGKRRQG